MEQSVQAIGGVAIVMEHPTRSRAVENIVRIPQGELPVAFTNSWNEDMMPRSADMLERSPMELQKMVRAYLPPSWCLVPVGITTSIIDIVQDGFQSSQLVVADWSSDRTRFLYNALQFVYTTDMHVLRPVPVVQSVASSPGEGTDIAERPSDHVQDRGSEEIHDQLKREAEQNEVEHSEEEMEDDGRRAVVERRPMDESTNTKDDNTLEEDTSEDDTSGDEESLEDEDDGDGQEPSTRTLHSDSTQQSREASTETSDNNYLPGRLSSPRQSSHEPAMTTEGQEQGQEHDNTPGGEAHEGRNRIVEMIMEQVLGVEEDEPHSPPRSNSINLSQPHTEHIDIDIEAHQESIAEGLLILRAEGQTIVPIVAVKPHLEVLGHIVATIGKDSDSLSFRWAMEGSAYIERGDGYYYDVEGVRYGCSGEDGQYTYEQVASVFEGHTNDDRMPSQH